MNAEFIRAMTNAETRQGIQPEVGLPRRILRIFPFKSAQCTPLCGTMRTMRTLVAIIE